MDDQGAINHWILVWTIGDSIHKFIPPSRIIIIYYIIEHIFWPSILNIRSSRWLLTGFCLCSENIYSWILYISLQCSMQWPQGFSGWLCFDNPPYLIAVVNYHDCYKILSENNMLKAGQVLSSRAFFYCLPITIIKITNRYILTLNFWSSNIAFRSRMTTAAACWYIMQPDYYAIVKAFVI